MESELTGKWVISDQQQEEFRNDYQQNGKYNFESQVTHLHRLADGYYDRFMITKHWPDALRAHALYNSLFARQPDQLKWRDEAFKVQQSYWEESSQTTQEEQVNISKALLENLTKIREITSDKLSKLTDTLEAQEMFENHEDSIEDEMLRFSEEIENISQDCTERMIELAGDVMRRSVESLYQKPPCPFVAVAIGSLAKGEATPYSDLEYIFLIQKKDEESMKYFKKLAITSYFIIGNLQETKLSYMAIPELMGWFDDKQTNGFKIDGLEEHAGNIPTGNGTTESTNILTPNELIQLYKLKLDNPKREEALRGDLTAMLTYLRPIYSYGENAKSLLNQFTEAKDKMVMSAERQHLNEEMLKEDIKRHTLKPERFAEKSYVVDAKGQLYRYSSLILLNISIVLNLIGEDSWNTLTTLVETGKISTQFHNSLKIVLAGTSFIRLSTYQFHNSHNASVSLLMELKDSNRWNSATSGPGRVWYMPTNFFPILCWFLFPLQSHSAKMLNESLTKVLSKAFEKSTWISKFNIFYYCSNWNGATTIFEKNISNVAAASHKQQLELLQEKFGDKVEALTCMCNAAQAILQSSDSEADRALQYFNFIQDCLDKDPELRKDHRFNSLHSNSWCGIGNCRMIKCEFDEAKTQITSYNHPTGTSLDSADVCLYLASIEERQGKFTEAESLANHDLQQYLSSPEEQIELGNLSLEQKLNMASTVDRVEVGDCIETLGIAYWQTGKFQDAEQCFVKALSIYQHNYGTNTVHPSIANVSNQLAGVYVDTKSSQKAYQLSKVAMDMYDDVAKTKFKFGLVNTMITHGYSLAQLDFYEEAEKCLRRSLDILNEMVGYQNPHFLRPIISHSFGKNYHLQGKSEQAVEYYKKCREFTENKVHKDYAEVTEDLASATYDQGNTETALELYKEAIDIYSNDNVYGKDHDKVLELRNIFDIALLLREIVCNVVKK